MVEYMLSHIITHEFEKVIKKHQYETRKAMHVGFHLSCGDSNDQYRVVHMYIFAPGNYVHVALQKESIDYEGKRHIEPMEHICYHDSCWRNSIQTFIFKNRADLSTFQTFNSLFDWYDVIELSEEETKYLMLMDNARHDLHFGTDRAKEEITNRLKDNPFDQRSVWKNL